MTINKGKTLPDGTYIYTCHCGGVGCTYCYALDTAKILDAMKDTRGQRYYGLLKAFLSVQGKAIVDTFHRVKAEQGGSVTPVDIGYVVSLYGLNFKATVEWLEETGCVAGGTHRRITAGLKVGTIMDAAREKYGVP